MKINQIIKNTTSQIQKPIFRAYSTFYSTLSELPQRLTSKDIITILEPINIKKFYSQLAMINRMINPEAAAKLAEDWQKGMSHAFNACTKKPYKHEEYQQHLKSYLAQYLVKTPACDTLLVPLEYFFERDHDGGFNLYKPKFK